MSYLDVAKEVIAIEADAIQGLAANLTSDFDGVIKSILESSGRVIV